MSSVVELTSRLVEIESINPDVVAGGAGEAGVARFVAEWCERAGLETRIDEPAPGRPNVVAVARGRGGGRSLILNAHMDTVGVAGMTDPLAPRLEGSRLHGRGAYDMKGSLAASMLATAEAARRGLAGDVILTAVSDEEYGSIGSEAVAAGITADTAIVTEPTEETVIVAHRGFVGMEIVCHGVAAHGSRPEIGVDAISKMGPILTGIGELDARLRAAPTHRHLGSGSVHASLIEGGQEYSSYPARCALQLERRTIPGETPEAATAEIEQLLAAAREADPAFVAELRVVVWRAPFEVDEASPVVTAVKEVARRVTGREPEITGAPYWADSALLADAGIPTVLFGPFGEGAHAEVEWVDVESLERCLAIYTGVAEHVCGTSGE